MKKTKINKCLCLLFITVCSILFIIPLTDFAVYADGSTKVIAHIETAPTETIQTVTTDDSSFAAQDKSNVSTGDIASDRFVIFLILLMISVLVIFFGNKKHSLKKKIN